MRKLKLASVLVALLVLAGCPATTPSGPPPPPPPGATNQFDATVYDSLMTAQATLESVKSNAANLPPSAKPALNKAIASYNLAEASWQAYHAGTNKDQAALQLAIAQAVGDVAQVVRLLIGGK